MLQYFRFTANSCRITVPSFICFSLEIQFQVSIVLAWRSVPSFNCFSLEIQFQVSNVLAWRSVPSFNCFSLEISSKFQLF